MAAKVTLKVNFRASARRTRMGANPTPRPWRSRSGCRPPSQRVIFVSTCMKHWSIRASSRMSWQWSGERLLLFPVRCITEVPGATITMHGTSDKVWKHTNSYGQIANPACRRRSRGRFRRHRRRSFFKGMPLGWEPAKSIIKVIKLCTRQARQLPRLRSRRVVRFDIHRILIKIKKDKMNPNKRCLWTKNESR